ncbi:MAG TPA: hypothetical protein VKA78_07780, partial [Pyrinomonadaceae bacterium]|nr:hypothetical protein [Pyrinomonadaceae bacterium]
ALLIRSLSCVLFADCAETVEIQFQDRSERLRLLSGIVMNFPIPALPFEPGVTVADEDLSVHLIPFRGRCSPLQQLVAPQNLIRHARRIRIEKNQRLEIRFLDQDGVEFFLDEDPVSTYRQLTLSVAGSIAFVPGLDYPVDQLCLKRRKSSWIGSVQGAVATWSVISMRYFLSILTPMVDQVATAPCTDPIQVRFVRLRQRLVDH